MGESIIGMLSVLQGIWYEAKTTKSENGLNKDEIVQSLVNEKMGFMAKSFYKKQYKRMKTEPLYRRGFVDVIEDLQEEAQILKAQGLANKPPTGKDKKSLDAVVNLAPAQVSDGPRTFSNVVANSPPKTQPLLPVKARCVFCKDGHWWEDCPTLLALKTIAERRQLAMKKGLCFRCMRREKHILRLSAKRKNQSVVFAQEHIRRVSTPKKKETRTQRHQYLCQQENHQQ